MPRGRKPDPSNLQLVKGCPGKRALNDKEPKINPLIPACPGELGEVAKQEWGRMTVELDTLGLISEIDLALLAAYCQSFAMWRDAVSCVEKYGTVIKSPNGYPIISPYVAMVNKQVDIMVKIASEFGMSPASRTRIKVEKPDKVDPMEALIFGTN